MIRLFLLLMLLAGQAPLTVAASDRATYEQQLIDTFNDMRQARLDQAMQRTRELIEQHPTSKLGQLLYADQLMAMAGELPSLGHGIRSEPKLQDLTFELRQRLQAIQSPPDAGRMPANLIQLAHNQPYILLFDQSESRLYVFRNEQGSPVAETDFFFSIGLKGTGKQKRGDKKTPVGVYHVTRYIDGDELPDLYAGTATFLEPKDYINLRLTGRVAASYDSITLHWVTDNRDVDRVRYHPKLLRLAGIDRSKLPEIDAVCHGIGQSLAQIVDLEDDKLLERDQMHEALRRINNQHL